MSKILCSLVCFVCVVVVFNAYECDAILCIWPLCPIGGGGGGILDPKTHFFIGFSSNRTENQTAEFNNFLAQHNITIIKDFMNFTNSIFVEARNSIKQALENAAARAKFGIDFIADNNGSYRVMQNDCITQSSSDCCLAKVSNSVKFMYKSRGGAGIVVFVIDSGTDINHPDFTGRATRGGNYISGEDEKDNNGHGTATMSNAIGSIAGVAKNATGVAIKVMNRNGYGTVLTIVSGMEEAANKCSAGVKGVVNLSVGGNRNAQMDRATKALYDSGCLPSVAAGNSYGADACNLSPAGVPEAFTVAASTCSDRYALFSNCGKCVDMVAPGENCKVAKAGSTQYTTMSGTSFSAPYVAGVAALYYAEDMTLTPEQLANKLVATSKTAIAASLVHCRNTVRNRIYKGCDA